MPQHSDGHPSALLRSRQRSSPLGSTQHARPFRARATYLSGSANRAVGRSRSSWAGATERQTSSGSTSAATPATPRAAGDGRRTPPRRRTGEPGEHDLVPQRQRRKVVLGNQSLEDRDRLGTGRGQRRDDVIGEELDEAVVGRTAVVHGSGDDRAGTSVVPSAGGVSPGAGSRRRGAAARAAGRCRSRSSSCSRSRRARARPGRSRRRSSASARVGRSAKPRIQTNRSGSSRSRNWPAMCIPAASCPSTKCSSKTSIKVSRCPGCSVYWRRSTTAQHSSMGVSQAGKPDRGCQASAQFRTAWSSRSTPRTISSADAAAA